MSLQRNQTLVWDRARTARKTPVPRKKVRFRIVRLEQGIAPQGVSISRR